MCLRDSRGTDSAHKAYRLLYHNWGVVAAAGEWMRVQAGFTESITFISSILNHTASKMMDHLLGLYEDPRLPLAYGADLTTSHHTAECALTNLQTYSPECSSQ